MKKLALLFSILFVLTIGLEAVAQTKSVRESIGADNITSIKVNGKSRVAWVHDNQRYIEVSWYTNDIKQPDTYGIKIDGNTITFNDEEGLLRYELHLDSSTKLDVSVSDNGRFVWPDGRVHIASRSENSSISDFFGELKGLVDELVTTFDSIASNDGEKSKGSEPVVKSKEKKRKYSVADRTDFDFHWGFTNWGDQWYNGLMKMDGPYNLRTSFSSYQLSENYAVVMTDHIKLSVGIGYESDVYKFTDNYVSLNTSTGDFETQNQAGIDAVSGVSGSNIADWSTRLVTRYVSLPVEFEYRDNGLLRNFRLAVGVIPGLSFSSSHTGLKHELEKRGRNYQDREDGIDKFINPYKLDVRFTFKRKGFGVFLQLPTMPLFIDNNTKVYPIKIGFML